MPRRRTRMSDDEGERSEGEHDLNQDQLLQAHIMTQQSTQADPKASFRARAELRERYHAVTSKIADAKKDLEEDGRKDSLDEEGVNELVTVMGQADDDYDAITYVEGIVGEKPLALVPDDASLASLFQDSDDDPSGDEEDEDEPPRNGKQSEGRIVRTCEWSAFGRKFGHLLRQAPTLSYIRPLMQDTTPVPTEAKMKKERKPKEDKSQLKLVELKEKDKNHDDAEQSVVKELDLIRKCLKREFKALPPGAPKVMSYYKFVLDPVDFSKTVENMFYLSFLVKDGHIRILIDEKQGLPVIVAVTEEERTLLNVNDRSAAKTQQAITAFTYDIWQGMRDILDIREPAIRR